MKLKFLALVALLLPLSAQTMSAEAYKSLKILMTDGSSVYVNGEKNLTASFVGDDLTFNTGEKTIVSLPTKDVKGWEFSNEQISTDVESLLNNNICLTQEYDHLTLKGLPENSQVSLYSMNGEILENLIASESCQIKTAGLQAGAYILKCNNVSFKILIK